MTQVGDGTCMHATKGAYLTDGRQLHMRTSLGSIHWTHLADVLYSPPVSGTAAVAQQEHNLDPPALIL
jgi:hypothetical protein